MVAYRHLLEYIQVIHLINITYVVKDLVNFIPYRDTLEHILLINFINVMYFVTDLVRMVTYNVQRHIRIHTGDKLYKCHIILYRYVVKCLVKILTDRYTLEYIQVIHVHLINVIYVVKCLVEILIYKITLEYIQCTYTGDKPYVCGKGLNHNSNLQTHIRIHVHVHADDKP